MKKDLKLSFEFFPPKTDSTTNHLKKTLKHLSTYHPVFMSVTYGALGSDQDRTLHWVDYIQNTMNINAMAHFTCLGVKNLMALRGDIPANNSHKNMLKDFNYASDLVSFVHQHYPHMNISVAGYPEKHPEAISLDKDLDYLKKKIDEGASRIVTQMFFNADYFLRFRDRCHQKGINCEIVPGIMPIIQYRMIEKITQMCGITIPRELIDFFELNHTEEVIHQFSLDYTLRQCIFLEKHGVDSFHFYTLNQIKVIEDICIYLTGVKL